MAYAFVSYAREDRQFVKRLTDDLRAAGIETWTDLEQIPAGASWQQAIEEGLFGANVLIYVSSEHSGRSMWMLEEVKAVLSRDIRVIPIIIDAAGVQNMPPSLRTIQWVDFQEDYAGALAALLGGLHNLQAKSPLPAAQPRSKGYAFISYAEEDQAFVRKLSKFMEEHGYGLWEFQSGDRNYSVDLYEELEGIIRDAAATLCVVSPHWKKSRVTKQEFLFSQEVGVPIFILRVADPGPTLALTGLAYIDFARNEKEAFGKLEKELKRKGL